MARPSPSSTTVARKRSKTQREEALNPSFADLPSSLLEVIMSLLVLKDNIIASAACKSWCEAAVAVRVVDKHPWLLCFPKRGNLLKLYDPLQWKTYSLNLPELADSTLCYSRDGWLLMRRSSSKDIFFFNPFSRELVSLPKFEQSFLAIAFSCPPTSDHCVVGIVSASRNEDQELMISFSTCHPGATECITEDFQFQVVFGSFILDGVGSLHSFDPSSRTWDFHFDVTHQDQSNFKDKAAFLAEKKGELFIMLTNGNEKPLVYRLFSFYWEKMSHTELDGLTIFVSFYNSELRTDLPWLRNKVCFSRCGYNRKSCVSYSFDESRYNPSKEWDTWIQLCPPQSIWIDPPKNVLDYL